MSKSLFEELQANSKYYHLLHTESVQTRRGFKEMFGDIDLPNPAGVSISSSARNITYHIRVEDEHSPEVHRFIVKLMELFEVETLDWKRSYDSEIFTARLSNGAVRITLQKTVPCQGKKYRVTREIVTCGDAPTGDNVEFLGDVDV